MLGVARATTRGRSEVESKCDIGNKLENPDSLQGTMKKSAAAVKIGQEACLFLRNQRLQASTETSCAIMIFLA